MITKKVSDCKSKRLEPQILELINDNYSTKEVATELNISNHMVTVVIKRKGIKLDGREGRAKLARNTKIIEAIKEGKTYVEIGRTYNVTKQRISQFAKRENYSSWVVTREKYDKLLILVKADVDSGMEFEELKTKHKFTPYIISELQKRGLEKLTERYRNVRNSVIIEEYKNKIAKDVVISGSTGLDSPMRIGTIDSIYSISSKNGYKKYPKVGNRNSGGLFEDPKVINLIKKKRDVEELSFREISEILNKKGFISPMGKPYTTCNVNAKYTSIKKNNL